MSKRLVVETLICANCAHFTKMNYLGHQVGVCEYHDKLAHPLEPFCPEFDGQPLLLVGRTPKRALDTETAYLVI